MFEAFSSGYYLGRLYVEPTDGDQQASIPQSQHDAVKEQLYADEDVPIVMKLGRKHFSVSSSESLPRDTLAVPHEYVQDDSDFWQQQAVFLAKPDRATQLLQLSTDGTHAADSSNPRQKERQGNGVTVRTAHRLFRPDDAL